MEPFTYAPSDAEIAKLAVLTKTEGWIIFERIMQECLSQIGLLAIDEMGSPDAKPAGWYKGYRDAIAETTTRIDGLIEGLVAELRAENDAARLSPARVSSSSGDTAS
jgi:hypothetical protein